MSKPKNNRVMCPDCGRAKMLFESESKAKNFIKWNGGDIDTHGGELRPYYCPACCGWHISSKPHVEQYDHRTETLIGAYNRSVSTRLKLKGVKGIALGMHNYYLYKIADDVWNYIPKGAKDSGNKKEIKQCISQYLAEHGIEENDGGNMRTKVYARWEEYNYNLHH